MSKLIFNGSLHQVVLVDSNGKNVGIWPAYNNVDSHATMTHLQNGTYMIQDTRTPHYHIPNANGPYGLYGIIRFNVPGHPGIGIHSGRAHARYLPGAQHPTMGCVRTTDNAMLFITRFIKTSPLTVIEIRNNSAVSAHFATYRNQHKNLQGLQRV